MSMTISRTTTSANILKKLFKDQLMPQDIHVPTSRDYRKRKTSFFIKIFFQNHSGLIAALNCKRQYLIIIFYNNNSYNRTFVHVIRIVIFNFIVTHG